MEISNTVVSLYIIHIKGELNGTHPVDVKVNYKWDKRKRFYLYFTFQSSVRGFERFRRRNEEILTGGVKVNEQVI